SAISALPVTAPAPVPAAPITPTAIITDTPVSTAPIPSPPVASTPMPPRTQVGGIEPVRAFGVGHAFLGSFSLCGSRWLIDGREISGFRRGRGKDLRCRNNQAGQTKAGQHVSSGKSRAIVAAADARQERSDATP